jgi:hypothetical protein
MVLKYQQFFDIFVSNNKTMFKKAKILLIVLMLTSVGFSALADKGIGKKSKSKVVLNVNSGNSLRNSISLNLKTGLKYTGSLLGNQQLVGGSYLNNTLLTYQKGNTVYIIPHKQVYTVPEMKQGYTGLKLIIKTH